MSSFRKRNVQQPIPGTRTSPQTGQVITSSGNPSLDVILGGGLPIGSICLIEEDKYATHSKVLAKYFLAEGILSQQTIFLGSLDDDPVAMLHKLPKPLNDVEVEQEAATDEMNGEGAQNGLRIAWRYNDLPMVNSEQSITKIGHHFNLLEQMDPLLLDYAETAIWNGKTHTNVAEEDEEDDENSEERDQFGGVDNDLNNISTQPAKDVDVDMETDGNKNADADDNKDSNATPMVVDNASKSVTSTSSTVTAASTAAATPPKSKFFENIKYHGLLKEIQMLLYADKFIPGIGLGHKELCRVCITSLGSPLWYADEHFAKDMLKFLTILRAVVRGSVAVCFITLPMHLVAKCSADLVPQIRNLVDYAIELESFAGSERETHPAFKEYSGLFHLRQVNAVNTLSAYMPETCDLAFKLRRKKFVIEKLHLPPELQDDNKTSDGDRVPTFSCASAGIAADSKASLDF